MAEAPFYIIWSPSGETPPRRIFTSLDVAQQTARFMSSVIPNHAFHVMGSIAGFQCGGGWFYRNGEKISTSQK